MVAQKRSVPTFKGNHIKVKAIWYELWSEEEIRNISESCGRLISYGHQNAFSKNLVLSKIL